MEQRRFILLLVFAFSLIMLWQGWMEQNRPPPPPPGSVASESVPGAPAHDTSLPQPSSGLTASAPGAVPGGDSTLASAPRTVVETDLIRAEISAEGGAIVRLELKEHQQRENAQPFVLFDDGKAHLYAAQSGLIGANLPSHKTLYTLPAESLVLADGQNEVVLRLVAPAQNGIEVAKVLTFHRGSYVIDVRYEVTNGSAEAVQTHAYFQFMRDGKPAESVEGFGVQTFTGPAIYTEAGNYQKVSFDNITKNKTDFVANADDGWVAMVQHYFVSAWLPPEGTPREYFTRALGNNMFSAGTIVPLAIAPGATQGFDMRLYAGPQEQDKLASVAYGLDLVVDYGWLTVIAAPLFWVLSWFYSLTGNWGWAIILVTILLKLIFFPLSKASYKSMAKMRVMGPRMQRLKELYGHDKARMQQEMMTLYKTEKINPLGGCLPILVQIPVFIALYWVLLGSVEMRQAPWMGWIQDLSAKDPYFILPIIMGASMLVQMKLNPAPPDPIQAKIMMAMPIVFTFMFLWFPAGLVLYWVVNNTLSIAQQWHITRAIEAEKAGGPKAA